MVFMRLNFLVILFCSILSIRCLIRFKQKTKCESKRDVTIVVCMILTEKYIKTIVTDLKEECINFTLVKLGPHVVNVNNLKPIDISFDHCPKNHLKEYLQMFAQNTTRRRTLIIFAEYLFDEVDDIRSILQMEKNVYVILISSFQFLHVQNIPRRLKLLSLYNLNGAEINLKNLCDVIKNPEYSEIEYDKMSSLSLAKIKCFRKSTSYFVRVSDGNNYNLLLNKFRDLTDKEFTFTIEPFPGTDKNIPEKYHYQLKYGNTSQLNVTGILEEAHRNVFVLILPQSTSLETANQHVIMMKEILNYDLQTYNVRWVIGIPPSKLVINSREFDYTRIDFKDMMEMYC